MLHAMNLQKINQIRENLSQTHFMVQLNDGLPNFLNEIIIDLEKLASTSNNNEVISYPATQTEYMRALIQNIRDNINKNVNQFQFPDKNLRLILYKLVLELTKAEPLNQRRYVEESLIPFWVCPLTLEAYSIFDDSSMALTSGYLYNREALIKCFETSHQWRDPVTRQPLPNFDINRILQLSEGLKQRQIIEKEYHHTREQLLRQQAVNFQMSTSVSAQIKQDFLRLTDSTQYAPSHEEKLKLASDIHGNLPRMGIMQYATRSDISDSQGNFSNLDLRDVYFCNNHLVDPFTSSRIDLRGANLSGCKFFQNLSTNNCIHADFTDANLAGARFVNLPGEGACIKTTDFTRANLQNVDFTGACNWTGVNVTGANLTGAYLYNKKGMLITGDNLKSYLNKHSVEGVDTAHFTKIVDNRQITAQSNLSSPTPMHQFGLFNNNNQANKEQTEIYLLKQQNEQLKQQNKLLKEQNRLFAQQPKNTLEDRHTHHHRHRDKPPCIVM